MGRSTGAEARGGQSILRRLTPHEAEAVLTRLLAVHPELVPEAEGIAKALIGVLEYCRILQELEALLGRKVDLVTPDGLSPYLKDCILASREVIYARRS